MSASHFFNCLARGYPLQAISLVLLLLPLQVNGEPAADAGQFHIKVLASSCAACHGTNGNSVGGTPVLAGLDANYFISQMTAFRTGEHVSTVMHHHAKGLSQEEINLLAGHFARQPRIQASEPDTEGMKHP